MTKLRLASVQFELRKEPSVDAFLEHVAELVKQAVSEEADVVIFPELAGTGLLGAITDHEVTTESIDNDYWESLASFTPKIVDGIGKIATEHRITILGGSYPRLTEDDKLKNTAYLFHTDGSYETQDKIHLTPPEHSMGMDGGNDLLVTDVLGFTVGILICADIQFPELSRHLVQQDVELIMCPSLTWNTRGSNRVTLGSRSRAYENQLFVGMSALVGHSGLPLDAPMYAKGNSVVAAPIDKTFGINDGIIAQTENHDEQILFAEIDKETLHESREKPESPGLKLQRPDLYSVKLNLESTK